MQRQKLQRCFNKPLKISGLSAFGIFFGVALMILVWTLLSMPFGIAAAAIGYGLGRLAGGVWHKGKLQRRIYWNLPVYQIIGGNDMPPSHYRRYF